MATLPLDLARRSASSPRRRSAPRRARRHARSAHPPPGLRAARDRGVLLRRARLRRDRPRLPGRPVRVRRRLPPPPRAQHLEQPRRRPATARRGRPAPLRGRRCPTAPSSTRVLERVRGAGVAAEPRPRASPRVRDPSGNGVLLRRRLSAGGRPRPRRPAALPFAPSATWRSGYAAACKAVYTGSIPVVAFTATRPECPNEPEATLSMPWDHVQVRPHGRWALAGAVAVVVAGCGTSGSRSNIRGTALETSYSQAVNASCTEAGTHGQTTKPSCVFVLVDGRQFRCPARLARAAQTASSLERSTVCRRLAPLHLGAAVRRVTATIEATQACLTSRHVRTIGNAALPPLATPNSPDGELIAGYLPNGALIAFYRTSGRRTGWNPGCSEAPAACTRR